MAGQALAMMPWFPRDFIAATRHWHLYERAVYRELLDAQWEMGSIPDDPARLARLVGLAPKEFAPLWAVVREKFVLADGGGLINQRLEEHRARALEQREKKAKGAQIVNAKRAAERPAERDAERSAERDGQRAPPSPSPSPSPSTSLRSVSPPKAPRVNGGWGEPPEGCDPQAWEDWGTYKGGQPKAATITKHANFMRSLGSPEAQRAAVDHSIRNSYRGCFAPKDDIRGTPARQPPKSAIQRVRDAGGVDLGEILRPSQARMGGAGPVLRPEPADELRRDLPGVVVRAD